MLFIKFRYKDEYTNGKWSYQECSVSSIDECIKIYGLNEVEYEILSVSGEYFDRSFGVNVKLMGDEGFTRYTTFNMFSYAYLCAKELARDNELNLWDAVEIVKISSDSELGSYYETLRLWELEDGKWTEREAK